MMDDSIIMFRDYGEIVLDIKTIMDKNYYSEIIYSTIVPKIFLFF